MTPPVAPRPTIGTRSRTLSDLETAVILLHYPGFHRLAKTLPYAKDDPAVHGHRNRDHPKAIVLLLGVMTRVCHGLPGAEAVFRSPDAWNVVRKHWCHLKQVGVIGAEEPDELPLRPVKAAQWRYMVQRFKDCDDGIDRLVQVFTEDAVALALDLGYFAQGSLSNPHITSCLFADGTELRSQYRCYVDLIPCGESGEKVPMAVEPGRNGKIRALLVQDEEGRWRGVDPGTGELLKKLPVDPEALASGKYGPTQSAYNLVPLSVRGPDERSRVTVGVDIDLQDSAEAQTILRVVKRVIAQGGLEGIVQAIITDKILRGTHQLELLTQHGVVTITKVAAAPGSESPRAQQVVDAGGKRCKTLPLGQFTHLRPDGRECPHLLHVIDGKVVEVDFNADATELLVIGDVPRRQVKRRKETLARGTEYRFDVRHSVECKHGPFDVWICPQKRLGDDGRKMAENYRIFPEGDPVFVALYGLARNTSEGGNAHTKATYPHKRSQSTGRVATLLDIHLYFFLDNVKTWYFQGGFRTVDPVLHPSPVELRGLAALAS